MAKKKEGLGLVEQLRVAIRDSGLTLTQLSKQAGISLPQITRFVKSERTLTLPAAEKLCAALGLKLSGPKRTRPKKEEE